MTATAVISGKTLAWCLRFASGIWLQLRGSGRPTFSTCCFLSIVLVQVHDELFPQVQSSPSTNADDAPSNGVKVLTALARSSRHTTWWPRQLPDWHYRRLLVCMTIIWTYTGSKSCYERINYPISFPPPSKKNLSTQLSFWNFETWFEEISPICVSGGSRKRSCPHVRESAASRLPRLNLLAKVKLS